MGSLLSIFRMHWDHEPIAAAASWSAATCRPFPRRDVSRRNKAATCPRTPKNLRVDIRFMERARVKGLILFIHRPVAETGRRQFHAAQRPRNRRHYQRIPPTLLPGDLQQPLAGSLESRLQALRPKTSRRRRAVGRRCRAAISPSLCPPVGRRCRAAIRAFRAARLIFPVAAHKIQGNGLFNCTSLLQLHTRLVVPPSTSCTYRSYEPGLLVGFAAL